MTTLPFIVVILGPARLMDYENEAIVAIAAGAFMLAFSAWLVSQCQHFLWVGLAGSIYGASCVLLFFTALLLRAPFGVSELRIVHVLIIVLSIGTAVGAAAALLMLILYRLFFFRTIEQDGTLCIACGYPARQSGSSHCPECGVPTDAQMKRSLSARALAFFGRRYRPAITAWIAILAIGLTWAIVAGWGYVRIGDDSWGGDWEKTRWGRSAPIAFGPSTCASRPIADDDVMYIAVDLAHTAAWQPRRMRIRLASRESLAMMGRPGEYEIVNGDPIVVCNVPSRHIAAVLRDGPPAELIARLVDAGRGAEWKPADQWFMVREVIEVPWSVDD